MPRKFLEFPQPWTWSTGRTSWRIQDYITFCVLMPRAATLNYIQMLHHLHDQLKGE